MPTLVLTNDELRALHMVYNWKRYLNEPIDWALLDQVKARILDLPYDDAPMPFLIDAPPPPEIDA